MNQILNFNNRDNEKTNDIILPEKKSFNNNNRFYLYQLIISSFIALIFLIFLFSRIFQNKQKEIFAEQLLDYYKTTTLYSNNTEHTAYRLNQEVSEPFVIGMIKIDKINLSYPILSKSSKDLLNISVCRFAGPMPNQVGNLCIAGHNYVDYKLFSNLYKLNKKDKIKIYDFNGNLKEYHVFNKYETNPSDLSCTNQETNGQTIVTLITCNNVTGKRLVVVCK